MGWCSEVVKIKVIYRFIVKLFYCFELVFKIKLITFISSILQL